MPQYSYGSSVAVQIASALVARDNCARMKASASDDATRDRYIENERRWDETLDSLIKDCLPSGSGFDAGTRFEDEKSGATSLIFTTSFHHMDDQGSYDGWTEHTVYARASFVGGLDISVTGRNKNGIKDYIGDAFHTALLLAPSRPAGWTPPPSTRDLLSESRDYVQSCIGSSYHDTNADDDAFLAKLDAALAKGGDAN